MRMPFQKSTREKENNLTAIRLEKGLFIREICEGADILISVWMMYESGMCSPLHIRGPKENEIRPVVKRILKFLECDFDDAFPGYNCKLETDEGLMMTQMHGAIISEHENHCPEDNYLRMETARTVRKALATLTARQEYFLREYYFKSGTFRSIASMEGLTAERVRQIILKGLRRLRHPGRCARFF